MGRGKRQLQHPLHLPLGDSDTRVRLSPPPSARDGLRRRFRDITACPAVVAIRDWEEIAAEVEVCVVDEPSLDDAKAALDELERLNDQQVVSVLLEHHERSTGAWSSLERLHFFADGSALFRVGAAAECEEIGLELGAALPAHELDSKSVYAIRGAAAGLWSAAVIADGGGGSGSGEAVGDDLRLLAIFGPAPGWDDRDPMWETSNIDVEERLAGTEELLKTWFAHLRDNGCPVSWAEPEGFRIRDWRTLLFAYDRFSWWPRRYADGFDDRFGIPGPPCEVAVELPVSECVRWAFEEADIWKIDPAVIAEAMFVLSRISVSAPPDDVSEETLLRATVTAEELWDAADGDAGTIGATYAMRFLARLEQLLGECADGAVGLAALPPRPEWKNSPLDD